MSQTISPRTADHELKAKHRAIWASGDYPTMVETFLLPLGPRLVGAAGVTAGHHVSRILMKLGVHNRAEAAAHAAGRGK